MTDGLNYSMEVLVKAHKLLDSDRIRADDQFANIWWVDSSSGNSIYRVQSDFKPETRKLTWITCTCPHGLFNGAGETRCYHAAAVLLLLRQRQKIEPLNPVSPHSVTEG